MADLDLATRARRAFDEALHALEPVPELAGFAERVRRARRDLERPMTVAIVGHIKTGKSTMTNALLGRRLAAVGRLECTYNVNWFRYGERESLRVHRRGGRPPEERPLDDLESLTRRDESGEFTQRDIDYIEITVPSPLLRRFSLVDAPGFDSAHVADSDNAAMFLGLSSAELTERTRSEASNADAILYLFSKGLTETGTGFLEALAMPAFGNATPINAIGVLTRVDENWRAVDDPLERAKASAALWMRDPQARGLFFTIRPVFAQAALFGATMSDGELAALQSLATMHDEDALRTLLATPRRFLAGAATGGPEAGMRDELLERLGQYGIIVATRLIRAGVVARDELSRALYRESGVTELEELVAAHFGNRAALIKTERAIAELRAHALRERSQHDGVALVAVLAVDNALDRLALDEHGFAELGVLRRYYEGALALAPAEIDEVLRVTGESGDELARRLGASDGAEPAELVALATQRAAHWTVRAQTATAKSTRDAAKVLRRSYERLAHLAMQSPALAGTGARIST